MYRANRVALHSSRCLHKAVQQTQLRHEASQTPATASTSAGSSGGGGGGGGGSSGGGGGGAGKAFAYTLGLGLVATGGVTGYAAYDADFRSSVEGTIPGSDLIFASVLGKTKPSDKTVGEELRSLMPKEKVKVNNTPSAHSTGPIIKNKELTEKERLDEEGRKKDEAVKKSIKEKDNEKSRLTQELEDGLKKVIIAAEDATKHAVDAKNELVAAINHNCKLLRKAVEDPKDSAWSAVTEAHKAKEALESRVAEVEKKAREAHARVLKAIDDGRRSKVTKDSALLINAAESLKRLEYQIEDGLAAVKAAAVESKIVAEFKDLVEKGREQFSRELRSILPNVDPREKGGRLSEEELNALIAHAHLRVDELRKQLLEQQLRESAHIETARARQRDEDARAAEERLGRELALLTSGSDAAWQRKLGEERERFEDELRAQLRRAAAAHSEHLEEVLRAQKERAEAEKTAAVNAAVLTERDAFHHEIAASMARLQGIEAALESRAVQDAENRRSKELWLACQNLLESILYGRKAGYDMDSRRKPLANELIAIKEASTADAFVNTLMNTLGDEALFNGVYTEDDLKARFMKVRKLARRVSMVGDDGASLWTYFFSFIQALLSLDVHKTYSKEDAVDPASLDTYEILSRARFFIMEEEDFVTGIRFLNLLKGEAGRVAGGWVADARLHLETRQAAQLLLAHAAAISIQSMY